MPLLRVILPTFLEGVGANQRIRNRRPTPSRKVGGAPNMWDTHP